ncbi:MAG: hypothetical protein WBC33_06625 [Conexibacter sp.]
MAARVAQQYDTTRFELGAARDVTIVIFYLGRFGPFTHEFQRGPKQFEIDQVMNERRASLEGRV